MRTIKYIIVTILMIALGMNARAQQRNVLQMPDVSVNIGKVELPISVENTDEITGIQFDITLPQGVTADNKGRLTNRGENHSITINRLGSGAYRVIIYSSSNSRLQGQSGVVAYLPVLIPASFEEGSEHTVSISNATIGKVSGQNVLTDVLCGKIHISKLPDFLVKNVNCSQQTISPNDIINVSWQVENIGQVSASGGWTEQISLVSENGKQQKLIATTHCDDILSSNGVSSRQTEIKLPFLLGIDGKAFIQVRVVPDNNAGESTTAQENNTNKSSEYVVISKSLILALSRNKIDENIKNRISLEIKRSGDWSKAEMFNLTATDDARIYVPSSVNIPANQSGSTIYFYIADNDVVDENDSISFSVSGNGYSEAQTVLYIEDNEHPTLDVTSSLSDVNEGETFNLNVSFPRPTTTPIVLSVVCDNAKRFDFNKQVEVPAGETSIQIPVVAIDNDEIEMDDMFSFKVSAEKFESGDCFVMLHDNDMPTFTFSLSPEAVNESDGYSALFGKIKRSDNLNKRVTIKLSDDSNGLLSYSNKTIVLEKNQSEAQFNIGVVDNDIVDGNHSVTVTAAVYSSSCDCSAPTDTKGYMTATITVIDDDGPTVKIKPAGTSMLEGSDNNIFVVSHNVNPENDVVVRISSDSDDILEYEHEVTIPAGQSSVNVTVKVKDNDIQDDSKLVTFKAEANNYSLGTCWILITDQTLPDAIVTLSTNKSSVEAEQTVLLTATVKNVGNSNLRSTTSLDFSFSGSKEKGKVNIGKSVAPGDSVTVEYNYLIPAITGTYTFEATVNADGKVPELIYSNNRSEKVKIDVLSPFALTAKADKDIYVQNDSVRISGTASGVAGKNANVEVYIINEGVRQTLNAITDDNGEYSVVYKLLSKQCGNFTIGACYPGSKETEAMDEFDVYGLTAKSKKGGYSFEKCEMSDGDTYEGAIVISNPGNLAQTGLSITPKAESANCLFNFSVPNTVGAGESVEIPYTIKADSISGGNQYQELPVIISSENGANLNYTLYYYVYPLKAKLQSNKTYISTTMTHGVPREYPVTIKNIGRAETGKITLSLPSWIQTTTSSEMASLAQGDSTTIVLRFMPTDAMKLNVRVSGRIGINCANGDGTSISFNLTPVSESKGTLKVDVVDEYTFFTNEAPHVNRAKVSIKNPSTNEIVAEGETTNEGTFVAELPEGYYSIAVDAEKHDSYTNTIIVNPGSEKTEEVFLSYQAITYSWNVEETTVEDEYEIETIVKYETRVPKPVVIVTLPDEQPEPNSIIPVIVTNKGLVNAVDVNMSLSISNGYTLEFINDPTLEVLAPQQAHVFYAKMVPEGANEVKERIAKASGYSRCYTLIARARYKELCKKYTGEELAEAIKKWGTRECLSSSSSTSHGGGGSYGPGSPSLWGNNNYDDYYIIEDDVHLGKFCDDVMAEDDELDPIDRAKVEDKEPDKHPCDDSNEPTLVYKLIPVSGTRYEMKGVVADGVSQLKLVLDPNSSWVPDDDCENISNIEWRLSRNFGKIEGTSLREAIFTAPDSMTTQYGASEFVEATVYYTQRTSPNTTWGRHSEAIKIEIIRPPVLIVPGLFDNANDWVHLIKSLSPEKYENLYYKKDINEILDYNKTKTHALTENYLLVGRGLRKVKNRALAQGYICTKVDVVGFGQGGLLARLYVQNSRGDENIHKLITMNTPHSGSEWADGIKGHRFIFGNIMRLLFFDHNIDGIYDLGVNSDAIYKLNEKSNLVSEYKIPVHAMATQNGVQSWIGTQGLGTLLGIGGDVATNFGPIGIGVAVIARYLSHFYTDDWSQVGIGDGYVSTSSQVGGCDAYTVKDWGYSHKDVPRSFNYDLQELLRANTNDGRFSKSWFHPKQRYFDHENWQWKIALGELTNFGLGRFGRWSTNQFAQGGDRILLQVNLNGREIETYASELVLNTSTTTTSFITNAYEYTTNNNANSKSRRVDAASEIGEKFLLFNLKKPDGYEDPLTIVSYNNETLSIAEGDSVNMKVPSTYSGEVKILVFMKHSDGNVYFQDYTYEINEPLARPVSLSFEETALFVGEQEEAHVFCTWDDGSVTRVDPDEMYFATDGIAKYADKCISATKQGLTKVSANYHGLNCNGLLRVFAADDDPLSDDNSDDSRSICTTVTLSFKQKNVMTRQAFRGTLTINNGNEAIAMTDVKMNIEVRDENGNLTTPHEFQIDVESLSGFDGELDFNSGWTLVGGSSGTASILFIPTKYAAPTEPKEYSFGGSFSYTDPYTGLTITRNLNPVTLTVNPSPNLEMTYFMQRDVFGDDPLTEAVEPMKPSEFALIVNNKGYGDAENMKLTTRQPEIIDNQKGLAISFELISTQLNGQEKTMSLGGSMTSDFGNIPAQSQAYAQWWLQSSLLGHFIEYDIKATHLTSHDNPDLSLLDTVTIHELIHGFTVESTGEKPLRGFLVNDIKDREDLPDGIYFTDATHADAFIAAGANIVKKSDTEYTLTVNASSMGWNYVSILDPTNGKQTLSKVVSADGREINIDNIWQTDRTLRDGKDPLYENRLHFVGNLSGNSEVFNLTFEPKPEVELEVESYAGVPEEGQVLKEQLTTVRVKFNKAIKPETFTVDDIMLTCQGVTQDVSLIGIQQVNEQEYELCLNEVTLLDGFYVLTVQTSEIEDTEGFYGSTGKQGTWIQFIEGKVALRLTVTPINGGTITPSSGRFDLDSDVKLIATPADGYDFLGWTRNDELLSSDRELTYHLYEDSEVKATFVIKHFNVNIDYDPSQGRVDGAGSGIYEYGSLLKLSAIPSRNYEFEAWMNSDECVSQQNEYQFTVTQDTDIYAVFKVKRNSSATMKIEEAQYSTFCAPFVVEVPTGVVAYTVDGIGENGLTLILTDINDVIPSNTPVIVYSDSPMEETFTGMKEDGEPVYGLLVGTYEDIFAPNGSYVLQSKEGVTGFYLVNHEIAKPAVRANHAYLSAPANSIGRYSLNDAGILDAIETIQGTPGNQVIIDLQGRHVNSVRRGVYIVNGRKLIK